MGTYRPRCCASPRNLRADLYTCTSCLPERHVALQEPGKRLQDIVAPQQWLEVRKRWRNIRQILRTLPYHGHSGKCARGLQAALDGDIVEELGKGLSVGASACRSFQALDVVIRQRCHQSAPEQVRRTAIGQERCQVIRLRAQARVLKVQDTYSPIAGHNVPAVVVTMAEIGWCRRQQSAERLESRLEVVARHRGEPALPQSFYRMFPKKLQLAQQLGNVKGQLKCWAGRVGGLRAAG